ncbi:glycosyltransferase [Gluconobacter sp. Dm-62]|uniref:glycosyltransferase n=1 Tax=Gluconobacter sp. Dm-62 TaxID=2799804 RepID=UPI0020110F55|nr:glycosyltransferase [Gluconobacter sp. Dm-62]
MTVSPAGSIDPRPVALFIDDRTPDPEGDACSVALLSHIRAVHSLGYRCCFMASRMLSTLEDQLRLEQEGIACLMPPLYGCPEEALRQLGAKLEVVYLHRLNNAESYAALTRAFAPTATIIWNVAELTSLRLHRQAAIECRPECERSACRLELRENMCAWMTDFILTYSSVEARHLSRAVPTANVHLVPWAAPLSVYKRRNPNTPVIAFVGEFAHDSALDAAEWLVLAIMPLLRKTTPDLHCRLIGSAMPPALRALATKDVEIIETLPNLADNLTDVSLCVAPLRFGAGITRQALDAWSVGLPIVMTSIAAEGLLHLADRTWRPSLADTPTTFAEGITAFLDPAIGRKQVTAGRKILKTRFSEQAVATALSPLLPAIPQDINNSDPTLLN